MAPRTRIAVKGAKISKEVADELKESIQEPTDQSPTPWQKPIYADGVYKSAFNSKLSESLLRFHNDPVRGPTERAKQSESRKKLYDDPINGKILRAKISKGLKKHHNNPETGLAHRVKLSETIKRLHNDPTNGPVIKAKISEGIKKLHNDPASGPALRAKMSDGQKRLYADPIRGPALRAERSEAQKRCYNDPERGTAHRAKISEAIKKVHQDPTRGPALKAKMSEVQRRRYDDPENGATLRAMRREAMNRALNDPERKAIIRAKSARSQKAQWAKKARTKWRHALRHPLFLAYRKGVETGAIGSTNKIQSIKRLEKIDEIDMSGTDEEKRKMLLNLLRQKNVVIPQFYDKRFCRNGLRYPGDGGPDPQVETDHESEEDKEDLVNELQEGASVPREIASSKQQMEASISKKRKYSELQKRASAPKETRLSIFNKEEMPASKSARQSKRQEWNSEETKEIDVAGRRESARIRSRIRRANQTIDQKIAAAAKARDRRRDKIANMNEEELVNFQAKARQDYAAQKARRLLNSAGIVASDGPTRRSRIDFSSLGERLRRKWSTSPRFNRVVTQLEKIQAGDAPESSLLILDLEYFAGTRKVHEVALGELNSGEIRVNARVDHECAVEELLRKPDGTALDGNGLSFAMSCIRSVYGVRDPRHCPGKKTVKEIAEMIIKAGVTPQSIIVTWHVGYMDLVLLKELLEPAGYVNILPPTRNCIPMIPEYWENLPRNIKTGKRQQSAALDVLFPVLFAGHKLVGENHRAMPDAQMLRLMALLLVQLRRSTQKRNLSIFPLTTREFVKNGRPPRTELQKWLGIEVVDASDSVHETQDARLIDKILDDTDGEEEADDKIDDEIEPDEELEARVEIEAQMEIADMLEMEEMYSDA